MGLCWCKACLRKNNTHALGAGQVVTLHFMVAVMQMVELFAPVYVQYVGPPLRTQNPKKLFGCLAFIGNVRKCRKTYHHVHACIRQGYGFCHSLIRAHMGKAGTEALQHGCAGIKSHKNSTRGGKPAQKWLQNALSAAYIKYDRGLGKWQVFYKFIYLFKFFWWVVAGLPSIGMGIKKIFCMCIAGTVAVHVCLYKKLPPSYAGRQNKVKT